jgi:hypothetical protein
MLSVGSVVGSFVVDQHLGSDLFGVRYDVKHSRQGSWHDLVVLPLPSGSRPREIMNQVGVFHPNLVAVLAVVDVEDQVGVVYERTRGADTLAAMVGSLDGGEALDLFWDVLQGVGAAHREGIVHLGLDPARVVIGSSSRGTRSAKVWGFRLAHLAGGDARTQAVWLSPYAAPELLEDPERGTVRSDVFALGAMLYELLTGEAPYAGAPVEIARAKKSRGHRALAERAPELSPAVAEAVERALSPDPADRFANVAAFGSALFPAGFHIDDATRAPLGEDTLVPPPPRASDSITESERDVMPAAGRQVSALAPFGVPAPAAISFVFLVAMAVVAVVVTSDARNVDDAMELVSERHLAVEHALESRDEVIEELVSAGADPRVLAGAAARYEAATGTDRVLAGAELARHFDGELQMLTTRSDAESVAARNRADRHLQTIGRALDAYADSVRAWSDATSSGRGAAVTVLGLAEAPPPALVEEFVE